MSYNGEERRDLSQCPITAEQAGKLLSEVAIFKDAVIELKNDNREFKNMMATEITEIKVNLRQLQLTEERNKSYLAGSVQGAKVGAKFGALFVVGAIIAGFIGVYMMATGKIDIVDFFK